MNARQRCLGAVLAAALAMPAVAAPAQAQDGKQQFADLGECSLGSGEIIQECRIGYRTWGTLNADKSNAVLILLPIWDESENSSKASIHEAQWPDKKQHFIVVIDTIGNKVSIRPDNSKSQAGAAFPKFTVRDMVEIDRRVLKEALGLDRVYAILGEQLGGMQALEWMVAYPDEMDKVIAITATPKASAWDVIAWQGMADIADQPRTTKEDDRRAALAMSAVLGPVILGPPYRAESFFEREGSPFSIMRSMQSFFLGYGIDRQARYANAIARHDAYRDVKGSMAKAVERVKADLLAIVLPDDQYTSTQPMMELAEAMGAKVVELPREFPQYRMPMEADTLIRDEVRAFLSK